MTTELERGLVELSAQGRLRRLVPRAGWDFSSNDYLGLAESRELRTAVNAALDQLRATAAKAGADFFHTRGPGFPESFDSTVRSIAQPAFAIPTVVEQSFSLDFAPPLSGWGLNE